MQLFFHIFFGMELFFYGNDLFISYEEWFKQTLKFAEKIEILIGLLNHTQVIKQKTIKIK